MPNALALINLLSTYRPGRAVVPFTVNQHNADETKSPINAEYLCEYEVYGCSRMSADMFDGDTEWNAR